MFLKNPKLRLTCEILAIILANALYAATNALFVNPNGLITCGTNGIALFVNKVSGFSIAAFTNVFYAVMFVVGLIVLGWRFSLTTLVSSVSYPLFYTILEPHLMKVQLTDNILLATIYAGLLIGLSVGIVLRCGSSTGGTDIPPLIANKYLHVPVSIAIWVFDVLILILQAFWSSKEEVLYGLILVLIYTVLIDKVLLVGRQKMQVTIVTNKPHDLTEAIISEMNRGVTLLHGKTGYLQRECDLVMTVVSPRQLYRVQQLVRTIDPTAFTIVHSVADVHGNGFSTVTEDPPRPTANTIPEPKDDAGEE
ncbi:MAG: YitT family protein [Thermoguttaceae bacterium]|nr:YitT family protein [Thermoguttaceae bacterium]